MTLPLVLSSLALVCSLAALGIALHVVRRSPSRIDAAAARAHDYVEELAAQSQRKWTSEEKLRHAVAAAQEFLPEASARALRIALEAHIQRTRIGAK